MVSVKDLIAKSTPESKQKARFVVVTLKYKGKGKDKVGDYYLFAGHTVDSSSPTRKKHTFAVKRYGDGNNALAKTICDCEHFTFKYEVALTKQKSSVIHNSNGKLPKLTNPQLVAGECKHILQVLKITSGMKPTNPVNVILPSGF